MGTTMAKNRMIDAAALVNSRRASSMNQTDYWLRFGVTQSGGSRYESGRAIPLPTAMLIWMRESGRIDDKDLAEALKVVKKAK